VHPIHKNETGLFQELARNKDVKFGQISLLVINPGCSRGGHHHARKEEWFCCIRGQCRMDLANIHSNATKEILLDESARYFFKVEPFWSHTLTNISKAKACYIIIIISEEYNESDPDTFKFEG